MKARIQHSRTRIIVDGAIAGLLGAAAVAVWFLILDAARGRPLETPALLAATLLHGLRGGAMVHPLAQLVAEYTVLHVCAFVVFGIAGALLLEAAEGEPTFAFSLVVFFAAFEAFFFAVVMFLGPAVMAALTWWAILVGNLFATAVMLAYFLYRHPALAAALFGGWIAVAREGALAGLIGAVIVALWFLGDDLVMGQAFHTPALLGAALLTGVTDATVVHATTALVLGYTVLHFSAFIVFGLVAALLLTASEWEPLLLLGVFVLFAIFEVFFVGFVTLLDTSLLDALGWWKIVLGNILALTAMAGFFMVSHRGLHARLIQRWATLDLEGEEGAETTHSRRPTPNGRVDA
jgi:hypothetical protein